MTVAVVDTGTAVYDAGNNTTQTFTFTVSSGATLAVFFIAQDNTQSITSVTWDQGGTNQACTLIIGESCPTAANGKIYMYGVVNPTVGVNKTLQVVQGTSTAAAACMQSYSGTVTTSVAAACTNALVANGTSTTASTAAQSGANGDMYVGAYVTNVGPFTLSDTSIFNLSPAGDDSAGNRFASTGATHTLSATLSSAQWAAVSCDIVASGAAANPVFPTDSQPAKPIKGYPLNLAAYNQNLFKNPFPFNQYDWSKPIRVPRAPFDLSVSLNPNINTNPFPFNQYEWGLKPFRVPKAPFDLSVPVNPNIFTNPIPFLNPGPPPAPPLYGKPVPDMPYNQNIYSVTVVTNPFVRAEVFLAKRIVSSPLPDPPLNINLFTNPFPFNQYDWSKPYFPVVRPYPQDGININVFTNPVPFLNIDTTRYKQIAGAPNPDSPYNLNLYSVTVVALPFNQTFWPPVAQPKPKQAPEQAYNLNLFTNPVPFYNIDYTPPRKPPPAPADQSSGFSVLYQPFVPPPTPASYLLHVDHYIFNAYLLAGTTVTEGNQIPVGWVPTPAAEPLNTPAIQNYWNAGPAGVGTGQYGIDFYNNPFFQAPVLKLQVFWQPISGQPGSFQLTGAGASLGVKRNG